MNNSLRLLFIACLFSGISAFAMEEPSAKRQKIEELHKKRAEEYVRAKNNRTLKDRCLECIAKNITSKEELEQWLTSDYKEIIIQSRPFFRALGRSSDHDVISESDEIFTGLLKQEKLSYEVQNALDEILYSAKNIRANKRRFQELNQQ